MQETKMFCGMGSFKDVDSDALGEAAAVGRSAKKKAGRKENPYASRGLDKFSTVLAELESRREKVLRRVGAPAGGGCGDHQVMVRFVRSEDKGWVPIVVKLPAEEHPAAEHAKGGTKKCKPAVSAPSTPPTEPASPTEDATKHAAAAAKAPAVAAKKKVTTAGDGWSWGKKVRPCHYWPVAAVLLLVSLVVFGRVFAICCTSIWWYLVPILSGEEEGGQSLRRAMAKFAKDAGKKVTMAPLPPSHGKKSSSGAHEVISSRSHAHGKKG